jgi:hypothetical protein
MSKILLKLNDKKFLIAKNENKEKKKEKIKFDIFQNKEELLLLGKSEKLQFVGNIENNEYE